MTCRTTARPLLLGLVFMLTAACGPDVGCASFVCDYGSFVGDAGGCD